MTPPPTVARTSLFTLMAMTAFAGNSLLCRGALDDATIDAASFTFVRLVSGALALTLIGVVRPRGRSERRADWLAAAMLFTYALCFSFAYLTLSAGTGALILFGAVQLTMLLVGLRGGETLRLLSWAGLACAIGGLGYLVSPGLRAPSPAGAALMALAGVAWGVYSLRGRGVTEPLRATGENFSRAVPFALLASAAFVGELRLTATGVALGVASGAVASGLGYVVWYAALSGLTATRAAVVQLAVPLIAAFGGVVLLSEEVTVRLLTSSAAILGGIALVLVQRRTATKPAHRAPRAD